MHHRLDGTVEGFDVTVVWPDGRTSEELVWTAGPDMWRFPYDPALPGLAALLDVSVRMADARAAATVGAGLEVLSLRPLRSAVLRDRVSGRYAKVVPPAEVDALVLRHRVAATAGVPVPEVVDVDDANGVVWLSELPGESHRTDAIGAAADEVIDLLQRLCAATVPPGEELEPAPDLALQAEHHAALLADLSPETGHTAVHLVQQSVRRLDLAGPVWPGIVHGDLHDGQILVDGAGRVSGLIDLDTLGPGDAVDDLARLFARLVARGDHIAADRLAAATARRVDIGVLAPRIALALVVSSVDAWRMRQPDWADRAATLVERAVRWHDGRR